MATVGSVFSSQGATEVGLYLADIWVRPRWSDGWGVVERNCPGERLADLTVEARMIGRHAGAATCTAMGAHPRGWEEGMLALIESEATFRGLDAHGIATLAGETTWWLSGTDPPPILVAGEEGRPARRGAVWLAAAITARWAASFTERPDSDLYNADVGDLIGVALASPEPDVGLVTPVTAQAGVGTVQMLYAPEVVVGWTAIGLAPDPAHVASTPQTETSTEQ